MKFSSAFKVGLLTFLSLILLLGIVVKVKGRAFSSAKRLEVQFKDVNGMRPGAAVQMMGMKVGQVEEVKPIFTENENYVKVKFAAGAEKDTFDLVLVDPVAETPDPDPTPDPTPDPADPTP